MIQQVGWASNSTVESSRTSNRRAMRWLRPLGRRFVWGHRLRWRRISSESYGRRPELYDDDVFVPIDELPVPSRSKSRRTNLKPMQLEAVEAIKTADAETATAEASVDLERSSTAGGKKAVGLRPPPPLRPPKLEVSSGAPERTAEIEEFLQKHGIAVEGPMATKFNPIQSFEEGGFPEQVRKNCFDLLGFHVFVSECNISSQVPGAWLPEAWLLPAHAHPIGGLAFGLVRPRFGRPGWNGQWEDLGVFGAWPAACEGPAGPPSWRWSHRAGVGTHQRIGDADSMGGVETTNNLRSSTVRKSKTRVKPT